MNKINFVLYRNTPAEQLQTLESIEQAVRHQQQLLPQLGFFIGQATQITA